MSTRAGEHHTNIGHRHFTRRVLVAAASLALLAAWPTGMRARLGLSQMVVFGTSLSDAGNAFALAGGTNTPPDFSNDLLLVPYEPYARGGHHLTNGKTWVEQLGQSLGLNGSVQPAFRGENPRAMKLRGGRRAGSL